MMTFARRYAAACLALAALLATPSAALGQSKADVFAGKIPPVANQLYRTGGRWELTLSGNLSLNDAFFTKYFGGLKAGYHFTDYFSVSAQAQAGFASPTNSTVLCPANAGCRSATSYQLDQVPGHLKGIYGLELAWSPIYGKVNAFSEEVGHFDLSIMGGADLISYVNVISSDQGALLSQSGGSPAIVNGAGGHVGVGFRLFFSPLVALRVEVKDYIYPVSIPNLGTNKQIENQLFTELGVSFLLPRQNRTQAQ